MRYGLDDCCRGPLGDGSDAAVGAKALGVWGGLGAGAMTALGVGAAVVGLGFAANKLSEQWEKQVPQAMELTAVLGGLTGDYRKNSEAFQESFNRAGSAASRFGYKLEEGMSAVGQLGKLGVTGRNLAAYGAASRVFEFERGTGANRESLIQPRICRAVRPWSQCSRLRSRRNESPGT